MIDPAQAVWMALAMATLQGVAIARLPDVRDWRALPMAYGGGLVALATGHLSFAMLHSNVSAWEITIGWNACLGVTGWALYYTAGSRFGPPHLARVGDYTAPGVWSLLSVMRLGCLSRGCCDGVAELYLALTLGLFGWSLYALRNERPAGAVVIDTVTLYCIASAFIELARVEAQPLLSSFAVVSLMLMLGLRVSLAVNRPSPR